MKNIKIELKWGIIFALAGLLWMLLERLAGLHDAHIDLHPYLTNLFVLPAIAIYVFALRDKRKNDYGGSMSYKQGFITGLVISLIVTVLSPLTQFITATIITPDYFNNVIAYSVSTGLMEQDAAEAYFNLNNYIIQSLIAAPIMGIITSAIVALFVKTKSKND